MDECVKVSVEMWSLKNRNGFTLIELVIVIILLGIIAAVAIPKINTDAGQVPPAADIVASDIQYTQMYAMTNNTSSCITLATNTATYNYAGTYAAGACTGGATRNLASVGANVTISAGQTIAFNSLGEPYGLAAAATITVASGGNTKNITVSPYTGKVTVQ